MALVDIFGNKVSIIQLGLNQKKIEQNFLLTTTHRFVNFLCAFLGLCLSRIINLDKSKRINGMLRLKRE